MIIKPTDAAGGRGVVRVDTLAQVPDAYAAAHAASRHGRVLVEELIDGPGVGFEGFVEQGQLVFGALLEERYGPASPSPCGHAVPVSWPAAIQARVWQLAAEVVKALGLVRGPFNLDLRLRGQTPVFIEINPRAGGAAICDLLRHACGFDVAEAMFKVALGQAALPHGRNPRPDGVVVAGPTAAGPAAARPTAVHLLAGTGRGQVQQVRLDLGDLPVLEHALHIQPGSQHRGDVPWVGWVLTSGATTVQAQQAAQIAAARLHIAFAEDAVHP